ncbi:alcohol dehydrogenase [Rhizobium anhuiense]|uniref:Alcohol dehydrogenase n=4 Tax=Rhizobium TaxID=379 RepID=A0A2A6J353_9HYPH|nr:alcohol dehydrogenase [Rhizobium sp. Pop5]NKF14201.1 alcohol dehydrogenase [Rhizobium phaseoli]PDS34591.1 alcohol dehydrogenase [Rhizobium anhuiense]PDS81786.1 alcohol dehydrogenase [Rhizobium sp. L18]PDT00495.1 alcohol dehydrogenase [Rhizobium chutanense]PDT26539.1 alcohol dehydrogenase [Rhizobium sp. L9]PDV85733.1 alcohol dehydrogenase [Rhizobium sp. H4]RSB87246.1 alcohol dehydrogenase [Rhizobium sophoriradicis]RUM18450.1 alcohol dehydrogenase [Rhizobium vallis]
MSMPPQTNEAGRKFTLDLGAVWTGFSGERPPVPLDAAIIFAPAGELVPMALDVVRKGGTVADRQRSRLESERPRETRVRGEIRCGAWI